MTPPPLVVGNLSGLSEHLSALSDRDSALSERATSRSTPVSPEARSSRPVAFGSPGPSESSPAKTGSVWRTPSGVLRPGVPSLGLGHLGTDSLAQRVAQRRQLAAGLRSERRLSSPRAGSLTATSPRARGDVPPEARRSEEASVDPSISPPRSLESLESCPRERSHSRARPQKIKLSERLPLLCTPALPTPQGAVPLHKPPPSPRDACAVRAIVAPSPSSASPAAAASHDAPAAEEHAAVATDDLRQLAAQFWAGVGLMVLGSEEPPSSAVAVGATASSVTPELSGVG